MGDLGAISSNLLHGTDDFKNHEPRVLLFSPFMRLIPTLAVAQPFLLALLCRVFYHHHSFRFSGEVYLGCQGKSRGQPSSSGILYVLLLSSTPKAPLKHILAVVVVGMYHSLLLSVVNQVLCMYYVFRRLQPPPTTVTMVAGGGGLIHYLMMFRT